MICLKILIGSISLPVLLSIVKSKWFVVTRESHKQIQIVRGSFLGIAVLSVLQVLNGVQLDKFVFISIFFFALGIPFLAFSFLIEWAFLGSSGAKELELPEICQWFLGLGIFAVVLGLVFLFFHLSLWLYHFEVKFYPLEYKS